MFSNSKSQSNANYLAVRHSPVIALLAALFLMTGTLHAQLDPRLQAGRTDFLDLYQQSTTLKPKPEIVAIFDFSGSMAPLMYHPLYQNVNNADLTNINLSFSIQKSSNNPITNVAYGTSGTNTTLTVELGTSNTRLTLTFLNLVKPNGEIVTSADADSCLGLMSGTNFWIVRPANNSAQGNSSVQQGRLYTDSATGTSATSGTRQNRDVRHWLMAASHARFQVTTTQSSVTYALGRTIDIPLPWKIMDVNSTGNPLSSKTIRDIQDKVTGIDDDGNPIITRYGSGLDIEFDTTYKTGLANTTSGATGNSHVGEYGTSTSHTTNSSASYVTYANRIAPIYMHWLFAGRWQSTNTDTTATNNNYIASATTNNGSYYVNDSSMNGKFIIFDALGRNVNGTNNDNLLAHGQTRVASGPQWGAGFVAQKIQAQIRVPKYNTDLTLREIINDYAFRYSIPAMTRVQANKVAAIQTWVQHQADVYFAYRYLDTSSNEYSNKTMDGNSRSGTISTVGDPLSAPTTKFMGSYSGWRVMNNTPAQGINSQTGNSVRAMQHLAAAYAGGNTPLSYAMARTLAQYNDSNNVFNDVMLPEDVSQCSNSFLILFTDGQDNVGSPTSNSPYVSGTGNNRVFNARDGNRQIINNRAGIETTWFNVSTYAAMGAHMANPAHGAGYFLEALNPSNITSKRNIREFLPFATKGRKGTTYSTARRVTTMTVGISLGGRVADSSSYKNNMFLGAVMGDTEVESGRIMDFRAFEPPTFAQDGTLISYNDWEPHPGDIGGWPAVGRRKPGAAYFFDANDPDKLIASLESAFYAAISAGSNNATSSPNLPFVGASLGAQVYMGSFVVPEGGGVTWSGDLRMFGTREEAGSVKIINKFANPATVLDADNAIWSASSALHQKPWISRNLFTRVAGGTELRTFTDGTSLSQFTNTSTGLMRYICSDRVPPIEANVLRRAVQFTAGGDLNTIPAGGDRPASNRLTIMGDIINSAPAAVEFAWSNVSSRLSGFSRLAAVNGNRFRLILVGSNQGWVHAFGEVTKTIKVPDSNNIERELVTGDVEELWAFMPTDFLHHLDYITYPQNKHNFMADGSPSIYHLDLPSTSGGIANGIVDSGERALAIFGLGKGGRSYYALNIEDPFNPKLQWTLVPDEAASLPTSRLESNSGLTIDNVRNILGKFGFSTTTPAIGRVVYDDGSKQQLKDAVFVGGGFSVPEVDAKFPDASGNPTPLGRSVMALDAYTGKIIAAEDITAKFGTTIGPVGSGVIPFEFIVNSGTAQRAYFTDYNGGLFAWGSEDVVTTTGSIYHNFRQDTSKINDWGLRKVYQDSGTGKGNRYTTMMAPFRVGNFPAKSKNGAVVPATVGIAMVSGDRNNPLDRNYSPSNIAPDFHRLTLVFDRQDSEDWRNASGVLNGIITDNALMNFSDNVAYSDPSNNCSDAVFRRISPGCPDYYLAPATGDPKFGYYINFPSSNSGFLPKGINSPTVVSGTLYYTIFSPEGSDLCSGGTGTSSSWVVADVINPLSKDNRRGAELFSGQKNEWAGVTSNYIQLGTRGVLQGGVSTGGEDGGLNIKSTSSSPSQGYPHPRVWRVIRQ